MMKLNQQGKRAAVQELLDQMREGKINCIIVKDFIRFGRPVYNGERRGGTAATMRYAQKAGREIIVIDPLTRLISHGETVPSPAQL